MSQGAPLTLRPITPRSVHLRPHGQGHQKPRRRAQRVCAPCQGGSPHRSGFYCVPRAGIHFERGCRLWRWPRCWRDYCGSETGHRDRRAIRRLHVRFNFVAKTNPEPGQRREILRRPVAQTRIACVQFKKISFPSARSRPAANRSPQSLNP